MRSNVDYLRDILEAAQAITRCMPEHFMDFQHNEVLQGFLKYQLVVIGEAVAQVSPAIRGAAAGVEWRQIKALRNRLAHEYFEIDDLELWNIAQYDIREIKSCVEQLISTLI